jgi:hypothetical protein
LTLYKSLIFFWRFQIWRSISSRALEVVEHMNKLATFFFILVVSNGSMANENLNQEVGIREMHNFVRDRCIEREQKEIPRGLFRAEYFEFYCNCMSRKISSTVHSEYSNAKSKGSTPKELDERIDKATTAEIVERWGKECKGEVGKMYPKLIDYINPEHLSSPSSKVGLNGEIKEWFINLNMASCMATADIAPKGRLWLRKSCQCIYGYVADHLSIDDLDLLIHSKSPKGPSVFDLTMRGAIECRNI